MKPVNYDVIAILGGWLVKEKGKWRTTHFDEADASFALGDRLRVVAAACLYERSKKKNGEVALWVSGGKGELAKIPDAPTVASIIKGELEELKVPSRMIEMDEHSGSTYEQLRKLDTMIRQKKGLRLGIISNAYHLPRIRVMSEHAPGLENLKSSLQNGNTVLLSAESVLLDRKEWRVVIQKAYASKAMKEKAHSEAVGVQAIKTGTYAYGSGSDQTVVLRRASIRDTRFLYDLRNEKAVRQASFSTARIPFKHHALWFRKKLAAHDSIIFIAEIDNTPAGQVRFDMKGDREADINIAISQNFRGKGYGSRVVKAASERFFTAFPKVHKIHAFIKPENEASCKVFAKAGYRHGGRAVVKGEQCIDMVLTHHAV